MLANPTVGMFVEGLYGRCGVITSLNGKRSCVEGRHGCKDFDEDNQNLTEMPTVDEIYRRADEVRKARSGDFRRSKHECYVEPYSIPYVKRSA